MYIYVFKFYGSVYNFNGVNTDILFISSSVGLSMDIKNDEAKLKARLREVGCMQSNTEMVTNCDMAISVFCEFASG